MLPGTDDEGADEDEESVTGNEEASGFEENEEEEVGTAGCREVVDKGVVEENDVVGGANVE